LADEYSYKSTYDYAENSPIAYLDKDGLEKEHFQYVFEADKIILTRTIFKKNGPLGGGSLVSSNHQGKKTYYYGKELEASIVAFKKAYEGTKTNKDGEHIVYNDTELNPTIGYGHLIKKGEKFEKPISEEEAIELFESDSKYIFNSADKNLKEFDLTENERNALYDAAFNMGPGKLKQYDESDSKYSHGFFFLKFLAGGEGIKKRRYAENILYTFGKYLHIDVLKANSKAEKLKIKKVETFINNNENIK
jgi:GH24 family phage-related lysozyme (muramidase)